MNEKDTAEKIKELQIIEQNLQSFLMQKQTYDLELNEILNALSELSKTDDEVYRILGGIMIKSDKKVVINDLEEKKKVLELRINSIEKQEKLLEKNAEEIKDEISKQISESKSKDKEKI